MLAKGGILVSLLGRPSDAKAKQFDVRATGILVRPNAEELSQIAKLLAEEKIHAVVSQSLPLSDAPKSHEMSETRHTRGKVVLEVIP